MEKQIYYIVKDRKDRFYLPGRFESSQEAAEFINEQYFEARERGFDNRHEQFGIYRVEFQKEFNEAGDLLSENQSIRLWMMSEYSEINDKYIERANPENIRQICFSRFLSRRYSYKKAKRRRRLLSMIQKIRTIL